MEELLDLKQRLERERPANWRELRTSPCIWIRSSPICPAS